MKVKCEGEPDVKRTPPIPEADVADTVVVQKYRSEGSDTGELDGINTGRC